MRLRLAPIALALAILFAAGCDGATHAGSPDPSTLSGKLIMGYQGWFACPGDAAGRGWVHWSDHDEPTVEMLPDVADLPPEERCPARLGGQDVELFSSQSAATVERHFGWMRDYGLDGVALQRFATLTSDPVARSGMDRVLAHVRAAAVAQGRVFFLMYDLSGVTPDRLDGVVEDWRRLVDSGLIRNPAYLHHRGHPLLGLWGLGFAGRALRPDDALRLLDRLDRVSEGGRLTVLAGVPAGWRTGTGDAAPGWDAVWRRVGVLSPWTVGRFTDRAGADRYRATGLEPDMAETRALGVDYMPVIFPGFSWANLMRARRQPAKARANEIPRDCGRFWWRQMGNARAAGATMLYGAMFDEVDEGTAMFKLAPHAPAPFLGLDADACALPAEWYMRLAGAATAALHEGRPATFDLPFPPPTAR